MSTGDARDLSRAPAGYAEWLADLKTRIHAAQQRAALAVNRELLALYWRLGRDILDRQAAGRWGDGILDRVASDLRAAFPEMRGFSRSNLKYMRAFAEAWSEDAIGQQAVGQLPWGHSRVEGAQHPRADPGRTYRHRVRGIGTGREGNARSLPAGLRPYDRASSSNARRA